MRVDEGSTELDLRRHQLAPVPFGGVSGQFVEARSGFQGQSRGVSDVLRKWHTSHCVVVGDGGA